MIVLPVEYDDERCWKSVRDARSEAMLRVGFESEREKAKEMVTRHVRMIAITRPYQAHAVVDDDHFDTWR